MFTNANCTLYSKVDGVFTHTHIYGVFWDEVKGFNTVKSGLTTADSLKLYVPLYNDVEVKKGDIVVKGIVSDAITSQADLDKKYADVHLVTSVDKKDFGSADMRHWEVGGR